MFIVHLRESELYCYLAADVRTRLEGAISEVPLETGTPVLYIKSKRLVKRPAQGHNKRTCRLVFHNIPLKTERQAGKL